MKKQLKTKKKTRAKKKKLEFEFEFIFSTENNQKIVLRRYVEESVVWWNNGKRKKVWTGPVAICEASEFIKEKWPIHRVIYTNAGYNPPPRPKDVYPKGI